ncbi:hypothetical protein [Pontibacter pamirensis]|uniref:hypothetical protein n=1 Tax=Pontibacter pamirensis TaxID=2562824 RepID=UPI001F23B08A|nr:hypothetical protein [Pontibacter pamirensis]
MKRKNMVADVRVQLIAEPVKPANIVNTVIVVAPVACVVAGVLPGIALIPAPQEITFTQMAPLLPLVALPRKRECML